MLSVTLAAQTDAVAAAVSISFGEGGARPVSGSLTAERSSDWRFDIL